MNIKVVQLSFVLFAACAGIARADAQVATHMGQRASMHVTLEAVGGLSGGCSGPALFDFVRNLPNGNSGGVFRIPSGKVLVVTDVDWQYAHPDGPAAVGTIQTLRLLIENLVNPSLVSRAFESTITLGKAGEGGISEHMTSGFTVSSKARVCFDAIPGPIGPPSGLQHLIVRGYLAPDK
jgi:hypothetical protein